MTARRLAAAAAPAVAVGVLAAGCGTGDGASPADVAAVKSTVQRALADLARGDGRGFCSLATRAGQAKVAASATGYDCPRLVHAVAGHLSDEHRLALLHVRVTRVAVRGAKATVSDADITTTQGSLTGYLDDGGRPTTLARQPDGSWKITG